MGYEVGDVGRSLENMGGLCKKCKTGSDSVLLVFLKPALASHSTSFSHYYILCKTWLLSFFHFPKVKYNFGQREPGT